MRASLDHMADMHIVAAERRDAGLPIWAERLDVSAAFARVEDQGPDAFIAARDEVVSVLRASKWVTGLDPSDEHDDEVLERIEDLACATTLEDFNEWWSDLYDHADRARVWIKIA